MVDIIIIIFFWMFIVSIGLCILITIIEKYTNKEFKFIRILKMITSTTLFTSILGFILLMLSCISIFIIDISYKFFHMFLNKESSQYLSLVSSFILLVYFGDNVIDLIIKVMERFDKSKRFNLFGELLKKTLKYMKIKKVLYGAVVIFTIISTVISLEGKVNSILGLNTSVILQAVVTFVALDTFLEKITLSDLKELKEKIKSISTDEW
ncbi:hypothetical protein [Clostridium sp.]|uniref:hypothetical protein n=1 Tax=Clostridium sp. TaxID=1506 RepID=UPI002FCB34BB